MNIVNKKKNLYVVLALVMVVMLAGCRTGRNAEDKVMRVKKLHYEQIAELAKPQAELNTITARTAVTLNYDGHSVVVKGKLKMQRDEMVQMTFTALGLMEVASVEFTPKAVCIVDRMGKRYARIDYTLGMLSNLGADFTTVQALFWNRLFIPGKAKVWEHPEDFDVNATSTGQCIEPTRQRMIQCHFYTDESCRQLQQTRLGLGHYEATWVYGMFDTSREQSFPTSFDVSLSGSSRTVGANITLNNISYATTEWKSGIDLSRYKQVNLDELMSILNVLR